MHDRQELPGVGAILIRARDPGALERFYAEGLGFPPARPEGGILGIRAANLFLGFEPLAGDEAGAAPRTTVWFDVPDARAAFARLVAAGGEPRMEPDPECSPGETLAVVADPEGNLVGLIGPGED